MSTFAQAVNAPAMTATTNGMAAYDKSGSKLVDIFFGIGSARNNPEVASTFMTAYGHDKLLATKCLFWARDVRGGAGERKVFRDILQLLEKTDSTTVLKNIPLIPFFGRWDDLLVFSTPHCKKAAYSVYADALLKEANGLAGKWAPRKGKIAEELRVHMGLSPKTYRKLIVGLSKTVEQQMCAQQWTEIEYGHVPSVAASRYQAAFSKHDQAGYSAYKEGLKKGTEKINASVVFPHDVIRGLKNGDAEIASAQWDALPDYVGDRKILPVSDVSGSMSCAASGSVSCMDVSIALGLYLSSKNSGAFKDLICTFSSSPSLLHVEGDLAAKFNQLSNAEWGGSTNLEATFALVLKTAIDNGVPQNEMPELICILSDMQFDQACGGYDYVTRGYTTVSVTALDMIKRKYKDAGYTMPGVIFWNLNGGYGNTPSTTNELGTVLISGFSPTILKAVLAADFERITPETMMLDVLNSERYSTITV